MKTINKSVVAPSIPSSVYGEVVHAMETLAPLCNLGHIGYAALMGAASSRPWLAVVSNTQVSIDKLQTLNLTTLDPSDTSSIPLIEEVLHDGIRLLGQREQLAATIVRLLDKITLFEREIELGEVIGTDDSVVPILPITSTTT